MLKLLKYDWKRNSTVFYATLLILVIAQVVLIAGHEWRDWVGKLVFVLSMLLFAAAGVILFYQACKTFNHYMDSYNRRLLPLRAIQGIGAVVILMLIYSISILIILVVTLWITLPILNVINLNDISEFWKDPKVIIASILYGLWAITSSLILIMLCITIAWSFRIRHRVWLGIAAFIGIQTLSGFLSLLLLSSMKEEMRVAVVKFYVSPDSSTVIADWVNPITYFSFWYELALVICGVLAIIYLMNKRIEL